MSVAIIVAIGWLYVTVLMAASQPSVLAAIGTLLFYGLLPTGILMYIMLAPLRRRRRQAQEAAADAAAREAGATALAREALVRGNDVDRDDKP
jgi:membrane protein implicated in regulation of membrane protease activity